MAKKSRKSAVSAELARKLRLALSIAIPLWMGTLWYLGLSQQELIWSFFACTGVSVLVYLFIKFLAWLDQRKPKRRGGTVTTGGGGIATTGGKAWTIPGVVLAILAGVLFVFIWGYRRYRPFPYDEVRRLPEEINRHVTYWRMEPSYLLFTPNAQISSMKMQAKFQAFGCGDQPKAQFILSLNDAYQGSSYLFEAYEYTLETGGDSTRLPIQDICQFINRDYDEKSPLLEAIRRIPIDYSVLVGPGSIKVSLNALVIELAYAIMKTARTAGPCIEVLVKGYADGQMAFWERPLKAERYNYQNISFYPRLDRYSENPFEYIRKIGTYQVPQNYRNQDLPNLRAMFVKEEMIDPFISQCGHLTAEQVHILEGYEFLHRDPTVRKA